jgi:hypothetical protein
MEDVLYLYNLPLNEKRPVVCFDELPVQLLGEVVAPLPMKKGQSTRFDYEYERKGTAAVLKSRLSSSASLLRLLIRTQSRTAIGVRNLWIYQYGKS